MSIFSNEVTSIMFGNDLTAANNTLAHECIAAAKKVIRDIKANFLYRGGDPALIGYSKPITNSRRVIAGAVKIIRRANAFRRRYILSMINTDYGYIRLDAYLPPVQKKSVPKEETKIKKQKRVQTRYTNIQKGVEARNRKITSQSGERNVKRAVREEKQRQAAKAKVKAEAKLVPKEIREAMRLAARDKRNPAAIETQSGQVIGTLAVSFAIGLAGLLKAKTATKNLIAEIKNRVSEFFAQIKKKITHVFASVMVIAILWFVVRKYNISQPVVNLAIGPSVSNIVDKETWRHASAFFREGAGPTVTTQSGLAIGDASNLMTSLLCFQAFKGKNMSSNVSEFSKRVSNFDRMSAGLESFAKWILSTFENFIAWIAEKFGADYKKKLRTEDAALKQFFRKVDDCVDRHNAQGITVNNDELNYLVELSKQATAFKDLYRGTRLESSVTSARANIHNLIHPHLGALNARKNNRPEPTMVVLLGAPGVGKTYLIEAITSALLIRSGLLHKNATRDEVLAHCYQRGTSEYWNGYSGQFATILDDLWQQRPDPTDKDNEFINIIRMIGSWAMPLNFADVESKGKIYFSSPLVLATTNLSGIESEALKVIQDSQAVIRRIKFPYAMRPVEHMRINGRLNYTLLENEAENCRNASDPLDRFPWHVWEVARHDFATGKTSEHWRPMRELLDEMIAEVRLKDSQFAVHSERKFNFIDGLLAQHNVETQSGIHDAVNKVFEVARTNKHETASYAMVMATPGLSFQNRVYLAGAVRSGAFVANNLQKIKGKFSFLSDVKEDCVEHQKDELFCWRSSQNLIRLVKNAGIFLAGSLISTLVVAAVIATVRGLVSFLKALFGVTKKVIRKLHCCTFANGKRKQMEIDCDDRANSSSVDLWSISKSIDHSWLERGEINDNCKYSIEQISEGNKLLREMNPGIEFSWWGSTEDCPFDIHAAPGKLFGYDLNGYEVELMIYSKERKEFLKSHDVAAQSNRNATIRTQSNERPCSSLVYDNTYVASVPLHNGNTLALGQVLFVVNDMAIQPEHYVAHVREALDKGSVDVSTLITFQSAANYEHVFTMTVGKFLALKRHSEPESDLDIVLYEDIRAHKNIIAKFVLERDVESLGGSSVVLEVARPEYRDNLVRYRPMACNSVKVGKSLHYEGRVLNRYWKYVAPTQKGDCGAPLTRLDERRANGAVVLGLHVAGCVDYGEGYANIVTREKINTLVQKLNVIKDEFEEDLAARGIVTVQSQDLPFAEAGSFMPLYKVETPINNACMSKFYRTPAFGAFGPYDCLPAHLSPVFRNGEVIYPMENAVKPYSSPLRIYSQPWLPEAVYQAMKPLCVTTQDCSRRIYSFEEAVLGVPEEKFRSIPRSTAAGFPYVTYCANGKKEFFGDGQDYDLDNPAALALRERVAYVIEKAKRNVRLSHVFVDFLKDEIRPRAKVDAVATRLISSAPLDYTIAWRQYFGAFSAAVMRNHTRIGMAPGICVYSEWDGLRSHLAQKGDKVFDGDFKAFDSSEQPSIHRLVLDEINRWYDDGEENARVRRVLWLDLVHSRHIGGKGRDQRHIYQWCKSLPSGHPFTTIINSIYSLVLLISAYRSITGKMDFWAHVSPITYGDDNACNVTDDIAQQFNQVTVADALAREFGVVYTPGRKDGIWTPTVPIEQITFLKRGFALEPGVGWLCPLEMDSFYFTCYYNKNKKDEKKILNDVLENTLFELSLYPQVVWDEKSPAVLKLMKRNGFQPAFQPTREGYLRELRTRSELWY